MINRRRRCGDEAPGVGERRSRMLLTELIGLRSAPAATLTCGSSARAAIIACQISGVRRSARYSVATLWMAPPSARQCQGCWALIKVFDHLGGAHPWKRSRPSVSTSRNRVSRLMALMRGQRGHPPSAEASRRPGVLGEAAALPGRHRGLCLVTSSVAPAAGTRPDVRVMPLAKVKPTSMTEERHGRRGGHW